MGDRRKFVAPADDRRSSDKRKTVDYKRSRTDERSFSSEKKQRLRDVSRIASPERRLPSRRDRSNERPPIPAPSAYSPLARPGLFYGKNNFFDFLTRCLGNVSDEIRKAFPLSPQKETSYILSSATSSEREVLRNELRGKQELIHSYLLVRELPPCVFFGSGFGTKEFYAKTAAAKDLVEKCGKVGLITEYLYNFVERESNLEKIVQHRDYALAVRALTRFDGYMKQYNWPHDIYTAREVDELAICQLREIFDKVKQEIYVKPLDRGASLKSSSDGWDARNPFCNRCKTRGHNEQACKGSSAPREERWINREGPLSRDFGGFNGRNDNRQSDSWLQDTSRSRPGEAASVSSIMFPKIPEHEIERRIQAQREELLKKERVRGMIEPIDNFDPSESWKDPLLGVPPGLILKAISPPTLLTFPRGSSARISDVPLAPPTVQHPYYRPTVDQPSVNKRPLLSTPFDPKVEQAYQMRKNIEEELKVKMEAERLKMKEEELERREKELEDERKRLEEQMKKNVAVDDHARFSQKPSLDNAAASYARGPESHSRIGLTGILPAVARTPYGYSKPDAAPTVPYGYGNGTDSDSRTWGAINTIAAVGSIGSSGGAIGYAAGYAAGVNDLGRSYGGNIQATAVNLPGVDHEVETINALVKDIEVKLLQLQKNGQHSTLNAIFDSRAMQTVARLGENVVQLSKEQKEELLHDLNKLIIEAEYNLLRGANFSHVDRSSEGVRRSRSRSRSSSPSRSRSPMKPADYREVRVNVGGTVIRNITPYEQQSLKVGDVIISQDVKSGEWKSGRITKTGPLRVSMQVGVSTWKKRKSELYCELYGTGHHLL